MQVLKTQVTAEDNSCYRMRKDGFDSLEFASKSWKHMRDALILGSDVYWVCRVLQILAISSLRCQFR